MSTNRINEKGVRRAGQISKAALITQELGKSNQREGCEREDHSVDGDAVEDDDAHAQPEEPPPEQGQLARG